MARVPANQRRRQFIGATIDVVATRGVRGATTREIASAAGAPLASLHYCFSSKDELFAAVFDAQTRAVVELVPDRHARIGMAAAATLIIESAVERFAAQRNWTLCMFELEFWAHRQRPADTEAGGSYRRYNERVERILVASARSADDPSLAEPLSGVIAALLDGLAMQWFVHRDPERLRADAAGAARMIERYLAARRGGRARESSPSSAAVTARAVDGPAAARPRARRSRS